jgi:hypothetical protein
MPQFKTYVHDMNNNPIVGAKVDCSVDDYFNPIDVQIRHIGLTDSEGKYVCSIPDYWGKNWGTTSQAIGYSTTSKAGTDFGNNDIVIDLGMGSIDYMTWIYYIIAIVLILIIFIFIATRLKKK